MIFPPMKVCTNFLVLFEALAASRRFLVSIFYEAGLGCRFNFCFLFLIPVHNLAFSTSLNLKERSLVSILPDCDHRGSRVSMRLAYWIVG